MGLLAVRPGAFGPLLCLLRGEEPVPHDVVVEVIRRRNGWMGVSHAPTLMPRSPRVCQQHDTGL